MKPMMLNITITNEIFLESFKQTTADTMPIPKNRRREDVDGERRKREDEIRGGEARWRETGYTNCRGS